MVSIDRHGQQSLFAEPDSTPAPISSPPRQVHFNNPDPGELRVAQSTLYEHLQAVGERDALVVRELLQGQDWAPFEARYSAEGRRGYHPALMASIVLYGLLRGVSSLRELERFARIDLGCWWVSGGIFPDHSVLGRFINRHASDLSEHLFASVVEVTLRRTGSGRDSLAGDGTVVAAMSSHFGVLKREAAGSRLQALQTTADGGGEEAQGLAQLCEVLDDRHRHNGGRGHRRLNPQEPEAVVLKQKNEAGYRPSYVPTVLANDARVVVDAELGIGHELAPMQEMIARLPEQTSQLLVDAGFRAASLLQQAERKQVEVLAPAKGGESATHKKPRFFTADQFIYDEQTDVVTCPAGEWLRRTARYRHSERRQYKTKACFQCPLRDQCTSKKRRIIERTRATRLREQLAHRMSDTDKQQRYRQRKAMVEPVFSVLRLKQGLNRFRRRHARGARLELMLHLIAYNLGRVTAARFLRLIYRQKDLLSAIKLRCQRQKFVRNIPPVLCST
jgi:transposase